MSVLQRVPRNQAVNQWKHKCTNRKEKFQAALHWETEEDITGGVGVHQCVRKKSTRVVDVLTMISTALLHSTVEQKHMSVKFNQIIFVVLWMHIMRSHYDASTLMPVNASDGFEISLMRIYMHEAEVYSGGQTSLADYYCN